MKSLVTGGCGFIGSHLVELLLSQGHSVIVLDNLSTGRLENLNHLISNNKLKFIKGDLKDLSLLEKCVSSVDYVFHLAAIADIVPSITNPLDYFTTNVVGTVNLLEVLRNKNLKKLIYAASSSCYGIPNNFPTPETSNIDLQYPYAYTKWAGEQATLHWGKVYKIPVMSLRLFNVYGPRSRTSGTYGAVFGVFLAQKLKNLPMTVVGDGLQTRDFTFVSDVAKAFLYAAKSESKNLILNVGSGNTYSIKYLTQLLGGEVTYIPKRPGEPDCTFADITLIKRLLNWKPETSFEEGVQVMLKSIQYWKDAPVWSPEKIEEVTKEWFNRLGSSNE